MTNSKSLFLAGFLIFCSGIIGGNFWENNESNNNTLNYSVKDKKYDSYYNKLTQTSRNLETIQENISLEKSKISESEKQNATKKIKKQQLETKIEDYPKKIKDLKAKIEEIVKKLSELSKSTQVFYSKHKDIIDAIDKVENLEHKINFSNVRNAQEEKIQETETDIEKLIKALDNYQKEVVKYADKRIMIHTKTKNQKAWKSQFENNISKLTSDLQNAKKNLSKTTASIEELEKQLQKYKEILKNFQKIEQELALELTNVTTEIKTS